MDDSIPTIAEARRTAGEALNALRLGEVEVTNIVIGEELKPGTRFTVKAPRGTATTRLKGRLEAHSFRILGVAGHDGTIVIDAFHSIRTIGTVERTAQHHETVLVVLHGSERLFRIGTRDVDSIERLLLTQKGDEVVIWEDVLGDWTPKVSAFANRTMPALR